MLARARAPGLGSSRCGQGVVQCGNHQVAARVVYVQDLPIATVGLVQKFTNALGNVH
jgi:hypothetical protein